MPSPLIQRQPNFFSSPKRSFASTFSTVLVVVNLLVLILGITYFLVNDEHFLWNIYGVLMTVTLIGNILLTLIPREHKRLDYFYLILNLFVMSIVPIMNTVASLDVTNQSSRSTVSIVILMGLFFVGVIVAAKKKSSDFERSFFSIQSNRRKHNILKVISSSLLVLLLIIGIYVSYVLLIEKPETLLKCSCQDIYSFLVLAH